MFKKILVPLDLTTKHQPALSKAAELARHNDGSVTLLHVIEVIPGLAIEEEKDFYLRLERKARAHLETSREFLSRWGINVHLEVCYGNRAREVARYASETSCDLIVLTAPHFDPKQPTTGWGSLSYKVGVLASCPVLLVK